MNCVVHGGMEGVGAHAGLHYIGTEWIAPAQRRRCCSQRQTRYRYVSRKVIIARLVIKKKADAMISYYWLWTDCFFLVGVICQNITREGKKVCLLLPCRETYTRRPYLATSSSVASYRGVKGARPSVCPCLCFEIMKVYSFARWDEKFALWSCLNTPP